MLIIFDLDDTLVETSKCLTPYYLNLAFSQMVKNGLKVDDQALAFQQLLFLNQSSLSSKGAVREFWKMHSNQFAGLDEALAIMETPIPDNLSLDPVEGALELLNSLKDICNLALVTAGNTTLQYQKMKKAGIQPDRFSNIVISKGPSKKFDYEVVIKTLKVNPKTVVVCGDRVSVDLSPAKELGFFTVHFQNGRGVVHTQPNEHVDLSIKKLTELKKVFKTDEG